MAKRHNTADLTAEERRRRAAHARATGRFYALIVMLFLILVLTVASVILWVATPRPEEPDTAPSTENQLFAVEKVTVQGNTKYLEDSVIGESGVLIGQSIFTVDSNEIEAHLLETFPYFVTVEVQTLHMNEVCITVTETDVIGVVYDKGYWVPVGTNGKALDQQEITSDRPRNVLYIKGAAPEGGIKIGGMALEEYTASVLQTILSAVNQYELTDITEIDLTDLTDVRMNWREQIEVRFGNTTNLVHQIGVVAATIPKILESRGAQATGVLNVSSYSNEALENQAIFTPSSLLPVSTTATRRPATGETTTTTIPPEEDTGEDDDTSEYDDVSEYWSEEEADMSSGSDDYAE